MIFVKLILLCVEVFLLVLFLFPVVLDVLNFGNIAGGIACAIMLIVTIFDKQFFSLVTFLWQSPPGRVLVIFVGAIISVGVVLAVVLSALMIKAQHNKPETDTAVIVLGCKVKGKRPSRMLRYRLDKAYEYLCENEDAVCIVSGGQGNDELISEAECMYGYLVGKGIESKRIIKEDKATSTEENLKLSKKIIDERSLTASVSIVTDGFHQYRASYIAKKCGYKRVYALCAYTKWQYIPSYWVREWAAILNEWLK
ncbi:MAG: YdcF family protein [Ruminococcus sp.]|nr:YdcF family protein [Ruminococcus sp.]